MTAPLRHKTSSHPRLIVGWICPTGAFCRSCAVAEPEIERAIFPGDRIAATFVCARCDKPFREAA